jgi:asparagine synthase (glutamine-hydrolysing)
MSPRYLIIIGREGPHGAATAQTFSKMCGLDERYRADGILVFGNEPLTCIPLGNAGCILGWLFHRHGLARQLTKLTDDEAAAIVAGSGEELLNAYWGGYVAAIAQADCIKILRDPSGSFPCYYGRFAAYALYASDARILASCGVEADIDFEEIGRELYRAFVPKPTTAVSGIKELLPGFAMGVGCSDQGQRACWSPWDYVADRSGRSRDQPERFHRTVQHCVQAWSSTARRPLLSVSGGLDSSIIAACLARAGSDTVCLTMFSEDPAGDERPFARALCDRLGLPLIERPYRLEDIDITEALAPHLPRPRDRTQANAYERINLEVASEIGADAFMTGNGGDHVLGYSQSAAPIADRYLTEGIGSGLLRSVRDVCQQTGCSIFDALSHAWRLAHAPPGARIRPNSLFLDADFLSTCSSEDVHHPWLDAPVEALPGKAAHISTILRVQPTLEASRGYFAPVLTPFLSQPIVEACLAIPSWAWRAGGRDRALARQAFAAELPPAVLNRRVKGTPSRFAARLLDHFRGQIRERVLGGRLAARGIVDKIALERVLAGERPVPDLERVRILELVNIEAWIGSWASRAAAAVAAEAQVRSAGRGRLRASTDPIP